eukprot:2237297-Rhodomonas_salina.3
MELGFAASMTRNAMAIRTKQTGARCTEMVMVTMEGVLMKARARAGAGEEEGGGAVGAARRDRIAQGRRSPEQNKGQGSYDQGVN